MGLIYHMCSWCKCFIKAVKRRYWWHDPIHLDMCNACIDEYTDEEAGLTPTIWSRGYDHLWLDLGGEG